MELSTVKEGVCKTSPQLRVMEVFLTVMNALNSETVRAIKNFMRIDLFKTYINYSKHSLKVTVF